MNPSRRSFLAGGLAALQGLETTAAAPAIRYRSLGKTGMKVTELGFGCEAVSDIGVIRAGLDLGINYYDTARSYESGNAESMLAKALGTRRKQVVLASRSYAKDAKTLAADLDASLRALGTDYLDIWYIGAKDKPAEVTSDMLEVQARAQKQGRIRFKGLSTHRMRDMLALAKAHFDVVLTQYNFTMGQQADGALEAMNKAGLGVLAIKVMAGVVWRTLHPHTRLPALKWALRTNWIHGTAVSMRDRDALAENMRAMSEPFGEEDRKQLAARLRDVGPLVCRMCGSCDGACPRGLPVSDLVRYTMYAEGYGDYALGRRRFDALPQAVRAVRCQDCAACVVHCPNGVQIQERAARAQQLFC